MLLNLPTKQKVQNLSTLGFKFNKFYSKPKSLIKHIFQTLSEHKYKFRLVFQAFELPGCSILAWLRSWVGKLYGLPASVTINQL